MNGIEILSQARERLADAVRESPASDPVVPPFGVSPWIAMSLLQKGIRRGQTDIALRAAATLLRDAPDRLWRRIGIVAFEDVGVGDVETIQFAMAALTGRAFRTRVGGEWAVASTVIAHMASAPKCRAADDLVMVVQHHPGLETARHDMLDLPADELMRIATGAGSVPERGLAAWLSIGTARCPSDGLGSRRGDPDAVFDAFCDAGFPETIVETAREGLRKTGQILPVFTALLAPLRMRETGRVITDDCPREASIGGVPSWAFDMFVREGQRAMKAFLGGQSDTARWMREHVPLPDRLGLMGNILFAVEGGVLHARLDWETGAYLRRLAEHESQGGWCPDGEKVIDLLRADLPILNEVRADVA